VYDFSCNYWYDNSFTTYVYVPCHPYCQTCTASWNNAYCQSCRHDTANAYLWLNWVNTNNQMCETYCPSRGDNLYQGQFIAQATDLVCTWCNYTCSWCADFSNGNTCYRCVNNYYLWLNWTDQSYTRCDNFCPNRSDYAFKGQYIAQSTDATCSWCSALCSWCADNSGGTTCYSCIVGAYLYLNWPDTNYNYCAYTCPSRTNNQYQGQYIANAADHTCTWCNYTCSWCGDLSGGNTCYRCVNNYYLWLNWTDQSFTRCDNFCPNRSDYAFTGQYIAHTTDATCSWCSSLCSWCENYSGGTTCFSCVVGAYLWLNWTDHSYTYCATYCPKRSDNAFQGQYIAQTSDHICTWCNVTCSWCADLSGGNTCYTCITTAYLLANNALCMSSFPYDNGYCYPDY